MLKSMHPSIFRWFKWFNEQSLFKNSQWLSCYHWISLLLHDSWHGCPSKLRLNKKNLCVIPSYYSVSSWQQGRVIVRKLIGFAGLSALLNSHCGSVGTVITHQLDCGVSAAVSGEKSPRPQISYSRWICHPCITPSPQLVKFDLFPSICVVKNAF